MGTARRIWAALRRLARDPGANALSGAAIGALAGVLAVAASPLWLLLGLAAPFGRRLIEQASPQPQATDRASAECGAAAIAGALDQEDWPADWTPDGQEIRQETRTEAASDDDWLAVAQGAVASVPARGAQRDQTSRSDLSDVEGSYVEF